MATLTSKTPANTYRDLLKIASTSDNLGITNSLLVVEDGDATGSSLSLSTGAAKITGDLEVTGNLTVSGTTTTIDSTTIAVKTAFVFEGATADAFETTLQVTDPTADRTLTLPNATGTIALIENKLSVFAATTSSELLGVISDETGTGSLVFASSPTLVTPNLGTPSTLIGTNITGTATSFTSSNVTTNANLTGHITSSGNAAILGSFTVAQLSAAISDEDLSGTNTGDNAGVTSISGTSPIAITGTTTPTISIGSASASASGALSNTDWSTFNSKQAAITLTTTGTSGASTLSGATLNIPNYATDLSGYLPLAGGTMTGDILLTNKEIKLKNEFYIKGKDQGDTTYYKLIGLDVSDEVSIDPQGRGVTLGGTLSVLTDAAIGGTLGVTGVSTLASAVITGAATVGTTLGVTGAITGSANATINGSDRIITIKSGSLLANSLFRYSDNTNNKFSTGFNNLDYIIYDDVNSAYRLKIDGSTGSFQIQNSATIGGTLGVTGIITAKEGTAASPSINATSHSNDGIFWATGGGGGYVAFTAAGVIRGYFGNGAGLTSEGNAQINGTLGVTGITTAADHIKLITTTANSKYFNVKNSGVSNGAYFGIEDANGGELVAGSAGYSCVIGNYDAFKTHIMSNNIIGLTVDTAGLVGIGTTSPNAKLEIHENSNADTELRIMGQAGYDPRIYLKSEEADSEGFKLWYDNSVGDTYFDNIYSQATQTLPAIRFRTNLDGTTNSLVNAMTIIHNGNVGIGTTTPNAKLSLGNTTSSAKLLLYDGGTTAQGGNGYFAGFAVDSPSANDTTLLAHYQGALVFGRYTNANDTSAITERMRITSAGNVGIGTSSPLSILQITTSAWAKLTLETTGVTSLVRQASDSNGMNFTTNALWAPGWTRDDVTKSSFAYIQHLGNSRMEFRVAPPASGAISWNTAMVIQDSGNVGIGTSSPSTLLHLSTTNASGALKLTSTTGTNASYMSFSNTGGNAFVGREGSAGNNLGSVSLPYALALVTESAYPIEFVTNNVTRAIIDSTGNVGIGETSPAAKLHVNGNIRQSSSGQTIGTVLASGTVSMGDTEVIDLNAAGGNCAAGIIVAIASFSSSVGNSVLMCHHLHTQSVNTYVAITNQNDHADLQMTRSSGNLSIVNSSVTTDADYIVKYIQLSAISEII